MKIELEISDPVMAAKVVNNAAVAYERVLFAAMLGCEVPKGFEVLYDMTDDERKRQVNCLKDIIRQLDAVTT